MVLFFNSAGCGVEYKYRVGKKSTFGANRFSREKSKKKQNKQECWPGLIGWKEKATSKWNSTANVRGHNLMDET